ncbi:MAG TPA: TrmH family RNA methyltransferase [Flavobacteriia bacterium]|nr:TrmH family RNA methyltransferase [Flavobacteriia bacterium]
MKNQIDYLSSFITPERLKRFDTILAERTKHFTVVLEDLYQKHNQSAIVRSCDIFGIQDVHVIENKYVSYMSNQVAKGAQKWLDFKMYDSINHNTQNCIDAIKNAGYQLIVTSPHIDSCLLSEFDITKKAAFVFGVEKEGVSQQMIEQADGFIKIPMYGFTESLNVSVATAIILQNVTERIRNTNLDWKLTEKELLKTKLKWLKKSIKNIDKIMERYHQSL